MTGPLPSEGEKIRVLVVDDSPMTRQFLAHLIASAPDMELAGEASTGLEAVRLNYSLRPHIIAMDLNMPVMDGLQAARLIMREYPTRIVMLGIGTQLADPTIVEQVTETGALDLCEKPSSSNDAEAATRLLKTLRAMARVGVVRRYRSTDEHDPLPVRLAEYPGMRLQPEIVLIVSSTGGPHALETIIKALPTHFPLPIVIVQHISDEFVGSMTNWLGANSPLPIKMAEQGERPQPGWIYIAPIGVHLRMAFNGRFSLESDTESHRHVPSGDVLLESAADTYGANAIGVVLTGMGMDGARGLTKMRERGAHTIVQDEATSIVFGMPKAAIELGASEYVVPLEKIAGLLVELSTEGRG